MIIGPGLRWVVESCRNVTEGPAAAFAASIPCPNEILERLIPADVLANLRAENLLVTPKPDHTQFAMRCESINGLVSLLPINQSVNGEFVHLNGDSVWLAQLVWRYGSTGEYAVDIGTGNGIVAAHLVAKYRRVLATDLDGPWMKYAQLTLAANAGRGRPTAVVACDVASALRPKSFDLVASNSPWSPAVPLDEHGRPLTFMAGGPTGTELPIRFLRQSAELLRPGGTAIILCLDPTFQDGSRPLMPVLDELESKGYELELVDSQVFDPEVVTNKLRQHRLPTLHKARHLAVVIRA